jgi:DNA-binding NarL/FixJ family response regulator
MASDKLAKLSKCEASAMRLLAQGKPNKGSARALEIEEVTIKVHMRNVFRKIGATNRTDPIRITLQNDWQ